MVFQPFPPRRCSCRAVSRPRSFFLGSALFCDSKPFSAVAWLSLSQNWQNRHLQACEIWTRAIFHQLTELLSADASWAVGRPEILSGSLRLVHSASFLMYGQRPRSRRSSWRGPPPRGGNRWAGLWFCLSKTVFIVPSPRGRLAVAPAAAATSLCRLSSAL